MSEDTAILWGMYEAGDHGNQTARLSGSKKYSVCGSRLYVHNLPSVSCSSSLCLHLVSGLSNKRKRPPNVTKVALMLHTPCSDLTRWEENKVNHPHI